MRRLTSKELIKEMPLIQSVALPKQWFDNLNSDKSVFSLLYEWMLTEGEVPKIYEKNIDRVTYVGSDIYKKLLGAEKKRLRKKYKIST